MKQLVQRNASLALDEARSENEKLRADLASIRSVYDFAMLEAKIAELRELLRGTGANRYWEGRWRDAEAGLTRIRGDVLQMHAELAELRAALKPFAVWIDKVDTTAPSESATDNNRTCLINGGAVVTYGDFRRASLAYEQKVGEK